MKPPATYGEWSAMLDFAATRFTDAEVLSALGSGTLDAGRSSAARLYERIVEFENVVLKRRLRRLERELQLMGDGGSDSLSLLLARFSRDCTGLLFFRRLSCLPKERIAELDRAVCAAIAAAFAELRGHLQRDADAQEASLRLIARLESKWAKGVTTQ